MRIRNHRPQFVDVDALATFADTFLPENGSARRIERNRNAGNRHRYRQDDANRNAEANIKSTLHREIARSALLGGNSRGIRRRCFVGAGCHIVRSRHRILNRRRKLHFGMLRTGNSRHGGTSTRLLHIFGCLAAIFAHFSLSKSLPWALLTICRPAWARTVRPPIGISRYARRLRWFTLRTQSSLPLSGPSTITSLPSSM